MKYTNSKQHKLRIASKEEKIFSQPVHCFSEKCHVFFVTYVKSKETKKKGPKIARITQRTKLLLIQHCVYILHNSFTLYLYSLLHTKEIKHRNIRSNLTLTFLSHRQTEFTQLLLFLLVFHGIAL